MKEGFIDEKISAQFNFYLTTAGIAFFIVLCVFIYEQLVKKGDPLYGDSIGYSSPGDIPSFGFFKRFTNFQLFLLSVIFFLSLGLFNITYFVETGYGLTTYTGVSFLPMQFTALDSTLFSSALIPSSENLALASIVALLYLGLRIFARKYNVSRFNFIVMTFTIIPAICALFWLAWHNTVYGGMEFALTVTALFGLIQGILIVVTGSFIPAWVMHISNNLYVDLLRFFSSDSMFLLMGGIIFGFVILYSFLYRGRLLGEKNRNPSF